MADERRCRWGQALVAAVGTSAREVMVCCGWWQLVQWLLQGCRSSAGGCCEALRVTHWRMTGTVCQSNEMQASG